MATRSISLEGHELGRKVVSALEQIFKGEKSVRLESCRTNTSLPIPTVILCVSVCVRVRVHACVRVCHED
jgi:hypothetical protein